ncbi:MAG TPA: hypothetical protein PLJ08_01990 [Cyclobacteriaceae bacterium]|nr:hypothetical protein [Cyclobacteriaceae bacterium]
MSNLLIARTRYFYKPWPWFKTIAIIGFIGLMALSWELADEDGKYSWLRYSIFAILVFGLATAPVDDIGLDKNHFYYWRTSILPNLSKEIKFDIGQIKSIRAGGNHTWGSDIFQSLLLRGGGRNTIEITLRDDSYRSLDFAIYKNDLQTIISKVKEQIIL